MKRRPERRRRQNSSRTATGFVSSAAASELNRETLCVTGLKSGKYALKIDGQPVGDYNSEQLAQGIDLAGNHGTPQYLQAEKIAALNMERGNVTARLWTMAWVEAMGASIRVDRDRVETQRKGASPPGKPARQISKGSSGS